MEPINLSNRSDSDERPIKSKNRSMFDAIRCIQKTYDITFEQARSLFWQMTEKAQQTWMQS